MSKNPLITHYVAASLAIWAILTWRLYTQSSSQGSFESLHDDPTPTLTVQSPSNSGHLESDSNHLFWFVQLSDIHLSEFGDGFGAENLEQFLKVEQGIIRPHFVVVTGDLTDAKSRSGLTCKQRETEWKKYESILKEHGIWSNTNYWLDLRGNHDCFNVDSWNSDDNYFKKYSVQKEASYYKEFNFEFGTYAVIAIDGCPRYGPSRPYNFFGTLDRDKMDKLETHIQLAKSAKASHIILIGHYPTVTLQSQRASSGKSFKELTESVSLYLSGHLHQLLLGLGKKILAFQRPGFLDIEIADLKDHAAFRIVAVDHNQVSFSDHRLKQGPYIHLLNPKPAEQLLPNHDPRDAVENSSHVRVLIFHLKDVERVSIRFDNHGQHIIGQLAENSSNLWVFPWNPSHYSDKTLHNLDVEVEIEGHFISHGSFKFNIGGKPSSFGTFGEFLLHLNFRKLVHCSFWILYLSAITFTATLLIFANKDGSPAQLRLRLETSIMKYSRSSLRLFFLQFLLNSIRLAQNLPLSIPIWFYLLSISTAPSFAGYLATGSSTMAWVFLFGIYHSSEWIVFLDTWFYALVHLIFFVTPSLILIVLYQFDKEGRRPEEMTEEVANISFTPVHRRTWFSVLVFLWWLVNLGRLGRMKTNYGAAAVLYSPFYTWYFVFITVVIWRAQTP